MFTITQGTDGNIRFAGKLHDAHMSTVQEGLDAIIDSRTLDFSDLVYISSSGLGLLLQAQKRLEASGQALTLTGMSAHLRELFAVTRFDVLFEIK